MTLFLSYLINGISLGSVYAIIALGYTMVYGIAKMLNFAHGDVIMIGAYVCLLRHAVPLGLPAHRLRCCWPWSRAPCWAWSSSGWPTSRCAQAPSLAVLITAIGVSYFLQNAAQLLIWGSDPEELYPSVVTHRLRSTLIGRLSCGHHQRARIVTVLAMYRHHGGADACLPARPRWARPCAPCSEDKGAAQLMGINVNATISMTFAIGSALAAIAGVLLCSAYPTLQPTTGSMPGIKAFTAAVFGGIGSIPGAMLGGILLGVIEILGQGLCLHRAGATRIVFAVLIVVLLVKPDRPAGQARARESVRWNHEKLRQYNIPQQP